MHRTRATRPATAYACVEALPSRTMLSVSPALAARLESAGYERMTWRRKEIFAEPGEWIASFRGMRGPAPMQVALLSAKLKRLGKGLNVDRQLGRDGLFKITARPGTDPAAVRKALRQIRHFQFVEPNGAVWLQEADAPNDEMYPLQYALNNTGATGGTAGADVDAPEAWALAEGAAEVVVGVIDTGVDYRHADLVDNMWVNPFEIADDGEDNDENGFVDDVYGADFAYLDGDPMDDHGHGTHVAGIIAAERNNEIGVAGLAPNAKIMALRFLAADGFGGVDSAVSALNYAMDMESRGVNIRVTNNSWGSGEFSEALDLAIRASGDAGMLFVAAAGNGGPDQIGDSNEVEPFYPASYTAPNILSAAASDSRDGLVRLSNYGPISVDLAAPGSLVMSTMVNGYGYMTGTSMASPHIVATAAMAFGMHPSATWQQVHAAILRGVDPIASMAGKTVTGGRLNAAGALRAMLPPAVVGRHVFYNGSAFDGRNSAAGGEDDGAIATDKTALLPGETATFANYTSYSKGINGVMVDVRNSAATADASDFAFAVRTATGTWIPAPAPASVTVRPRAGAEGSDRVTLTWSDGVIRDTWLRVTVLAGHHTGLPQPDTFYFGNAIGDTGNSPLDALVNALDVGATRAAQRGGEAALDNHYDFNRDGAVNTVDFAIVRGRQNSPALPLITADALV